MSRKGHREARKPVEVIAGISILLTLVGAIFWGYPTIHPMVQGATEVVPLELVDGEKAYIHLENSGGAPVAISVNFSSDGSMRFKNDKGETVDSFEVSYAVGAKEQESFPFTSVFNESLTNATLFVRYRSNLEYLTFLPPRQSEGYWQKTHGKTNAYGGGGRKWILQ
jgi:hypothetical protein